VCIHPALRDLFANQNLKNFHAHTLLLAFDFITTMLAIRGLQLLFNSPVSQVASENWPMPMEGTRDFQPKLIWTVNVTDARSVEIRHTFRGEITRGELA
jgi:hypothetical protein